MKILVVGAGAIGGYFGGRLLEAGRDVTFLVRPKRAAQLAETGLVIKSRKGDATLPKPPTVLAGDLRRPFDLILLSLKAYDLEAAIDSFAPAIGPETAILPLLNGMRHLDVLDRRFGKDRVLGGECVIAATLDEKGRILHLNDLHLLTFGERAASPSPRIDAIAREFEGAKTEARISAVILLEMWEKWVMLASLASVTCLMRASVGDIAEAGGANLALRLLEECGTVAEGAGFAPRPEFLERAGATLTAAGSPFTASMLRDIERGGRIEGDHIIGDLISRGERSLPERSLLRLAHTHLKTYEARRAREQVQAAKR
jgi:2-dehydropantoate 2-reductase